MRCQGCGAELTQTLVDLGVSPLANSYVPASHEKTPDREYPLHARVCNACWLVQVESVVPPSEIFGAYAYFSSYSTTFVHHAEIYCKSMIQRFGLNGRSQVVEVASNDGYLLQHFVARGISCLGIEPAANVAAVARSRGVPTLGAFFGLDTATHLAAAGCRPDLLISNNVLAHVPDINDFVAGIAVLLKDDAVYTVEFPHLLNLIREVQFDTIYHEHYTYLSLIAVEAILARHELRAFDAEEISTHGGSLRLFICQRSARHVQTERIGSIREKETAASLNRPSGYLGYEDGVKKVKRELLAFLEGIKRDGRRIAGYGAAAKGNTLLNYCKIGADLLPFVVDKNPAKQGMLLPGSRIPIQPVETLFEHPLDFVLILPWNWRDEIVAELGELKARGCRFVTAVPELRFY